MRKCIFYLTSLFALSTGFCEDISFQVSKLNGKISQGPLTICSSWKIPSFTFGESPEFSPPCWGLSIDAGKISSFPLIISAGKLSAGGTVTRLKTPSLSSYTNPFQGAVNTNQKLYVNLPVSPVFSRPDALAFCIDHAKPEGFLRKLQVVQFADTDGMLIQGAFISFLPFNKTELSFSVTSGLFSVENTGTSWFSDSQYFQSYIQIPVCFQTGFSSPYFKNRETFCIFPDYKADYGFTISSENSLILKNISKASDFFLNFSVFQTSRENIYTASSRELKILSQYKINPYLYFYAGKGLRIKTGTNLYAEEKKTEEKIIFSSKVSKGLSFQTRKTQTDIVFNASGNNESEEKFQVNNYSLKLNSFFAGKIRKNLSATFLWDEDFSKKTYKAGGKISIPKCFLSSVNAEISLKQTDSEITSSKIDFSSNFRLNKKSLTVLCTAGISVKL